MTKPTDIEGIVDRVVSLLESECDPKRLPLKQDYKTVLEEVISRFESYLDCVKEELGSDE
jgi:hypothetical protein